MYAGSHTAWLVARVAFGLMGVDDAIECARAILKWVVREKLSSFTGRSCLEKLKGRWPKMALLEPGFTVLEERGYIRLADPLPQRHGPGRRPQRYLVNPKVHE